MAPGPRGSSSTEMEAPGSAWISLLEGNALDRDSMKYTGGIRLSGQDGGHKPFPVALQLGGRGRAEGKPATPIMKYKFMHVHGGQPASRY